jgi:copper chaperone CopZ
MNATIYCPDLECESCEKILTRSLNTLQGIQKIGFTPDSLAVDFDPKQVTKEQIVEAINKKGYRAGFEPFERKLFKERMRDFFENKQKYAMEYLMLQNTAMTFLGLLAIEFVVYLAVLKTIPDFLSRYGWWMLYATIAVVSVASAIWHMRAYRARVTSMVGMMIGMTFGMQTGMMLGTIVAATNGLIMGGMTGMLVAVAVGIYNGRCCGIMGVLEGMMAGVMGGLMGSMIGTMFSVNHILWLMPFFFLINVIIMWGLSYMLFEEVVEERKAQRTPTPFLTFFSYCFIATGLLTALIVYGPKTGIAALGG